MRRMSSGSNDDSDVWIDFLKSGNCIRAGHGRHVEIRLTFAVFFHDTGKKITLNEVASGPTLNEVSAVEASHQGLLPKLDTNK